MKHLSFLVAALLLIWAGWWIAHESSTVAVPAPEATSTASSSKKIVKGNHPNLSYSEAVLVYTNRRIQFDDNCTAIPSSIVLKNDTNVMFDNRSKIGRYITLDHKSTSFVPGYDFLILTLSSPKLPHTIIVDCGSGRNNATITLN